MYNYMSENTRKITDFIQLYEYLYWGYTYNYMNKFLDLSENT